jgi:hypothetical protein
MLKRLSTKKLTGKGGPTLLLDVPNSDLINLVVSKEATQDSLNVSCLIDKSLVLPHPHLL